MGQIKNVFSLILRSTCHFSCGLHDGCGPQDYAFLRKNAGICWRVVEEKKPINIYVCISNECAYDAYSNGFFLQKNERNISSA